MKRLLTLFLLAAFALTGCGISSDTPTLEATVSLGTVAPPATTLPSGSSLPPATTLPPVTTVPPETTLPPATTPPATTGPVDEIPPVDPLVAYLNSMSLEEKVGQLFVVAPEQFLSKYSTVTSVTDAIREGLKKYPVGGIILFGENIKSPEQLTALNRDLQGTSSTPLFIAVDEEGGRVARLAKNDAFDLPTYQSAAAVGATGDPENARNMGRTIGSYLAKYGFNLDFAPVADVNTNPNNTVIGTRAFSSDPSVAGKMAAAFADGLRENGIISTFKHFPGHGDTAEDSHSGLAYNNKDRQSLEKCEWLPFMEAKSTDMVMVGHIALPQVTGNQTPATMSYEIVTEILKEDLGFSGLVVTDSLQMGAITDSYSSGEAALLALKAGCDILLMPNNLPAAFEAVVAAVEDGTLSAQWLDATVLRILQFKQAHGILNF